jgi:hypothetical protein
MNVSAVERHILDVTLQEHRPFGEPMTGSLGKNRNKAHQTKTLEDKTISTTRSHLADHHKNASACANGPCRAAAVSKLTNTEAS